ncbi:MAG: Crp/Fnr family transcriptional regulator [Rhodospirillales bacterium]|nr:MAG: Crp/Fnr family transcriptional regulator [Rhodospirillales bacterium]
MAERPAKGPKALDGEAASRLAEMSRVVIVPAGRQVMMEGAPATELFSIAEGIVSIFKLMPDGRRQITGFLYPGSFFGVTFNVSEAYAYSADAVTEVKLQAYPRRNFERLLDEVPGLRRSFIAAMADELTEAQDRILLLAHSSASQRLACFLLALSRRQADPAAEAVDKVFVPMRGSDIADYLGLTAETVSRVLATFRRKGIIGGDRNGNTEIRDRAALEALAGTLARGV